MGPLIIVFLLFGISTHIKACPGCREVTRDMAIVREYLATTLQSLSTPPTGLVNQEKIELKSIRRAAFQVVSGIRFYYEFEGIGSKSRKLYDCKLSLVRRAWLNERKIEEYKCEAKDLI